MSELIAWCCEFLEELREEAVEHSLSEEFDACLDEIRHGDDCSDRLTGLLFKMGQDVEPTRGGYSVPPGLQGDQGAALKAVCPNGICSRTIPRDVGDPGRLAVACAIQNLAMPEKWVPRA